MLSQVTFTVEHGDCTDEFAAFCEYVSALPTDHKVTITDYTVSLDMDPDSI